jgi:hypothetical protein
MGGRWERGARGVRAPTARLSKTPLRIEAGPLQIEANLVQIEDAPLRPQSAREQNESVLVRIELALGRIQLALGQIELAPGQIECARGARISRPASLDRLPREMPTSPAMDPAPIAASAPLAETKKQNGRWSLLFAIEEKTGELPKLFDCNDIVRVLVFAPKRATLLHTLDEWRADGRIAEESRSEGRQPARFRKLAGPQIQSI